MKRLVLLPLCLLFSGAYSQSAWTPEVMIKFKRVGGTGVSPDGRMVAYTISTPMMEGEKSEFLTHIWMASSDGKTNVQFTQGPKSCISPSFSPDGNYLAFISHRNSENKAQVWAIRVNGGEAEQITRAKVDVEQFAWSPDGKRIAYTQRDADTDEEEKMIKEKRDWTIIDNWKYAHLYTVAFEKTLTTVTGKYEHKMKRLTKGDFHVTGFDWSPDSKSIAFAHQLTPSADNWPAMDISIVPSDSGTVRSLVAMHGLDSGPHYSPDGQTIAFVSDGGNPKWASTSDVYLIPAAGGQPRKLSETPDRLASILDWSADGKEIYVSETSRTSGRVFIVPVNGGSTKVLTPGMGNYTNASFSADGRTIAFLHQTPEVAPEVFTTPLLKYEPKKLSDANKDFPKLPLGKTEVIRWKSKDGKEVEGLLTYPVNYNSGKKYPLILNIHGGPAGAFTQNFTAGGSVYPIQTFAQQGYALLRPNPRGSSGYGRDFRHANYNDWGFGDYDDDQSGVDKVIAMGVAHPDSLVICGWSYGGYMTSFTVTKTNRYKAASLGAPVTNLMSFVGTSDIAGFLPDYFGGEYWDRMDVYMKHSAMFNVKNVKTPTQVIHGERDVRVPISQGFEFYTAVKRLGIPAEMITYPRTPHGVQEPKFIQDIGERVLLWFNAHLNRKGTH